MYVYVVKEGRDEPDVTHICLTKEKAKELALAWVKEEANRHDAKYPGLKWRLREDETDVPGGRYYYYAEMGYYYASVSRMRVDE